MKLVLVSPQSYRPILVTRTSKELSPPMGLLYLAAAVRDHCEVWVIDVQAHRWASAKVAEEILCRDPDVVGISINYTTMMPLGVRLAEALRHRAPELFLIAGGNAATFENRELVDNGIFDVVVLREGEVSLKKIIENLSKGKPLNGINGIVWRNGQKTVTQTFVDYAHPLDKFAFPDFDDLDRPEQYLKAIVSSRGCTHRCIYCSTQQMWRKWRGRSVGNIMAELDHLIHRYLPSRVAFIDDDFTIDRDRVFGICKGLIIRGAPFRWSFSARPERIDEEMLDKVAAAGCESIFFGIESGSDSVLKQLNRRYTIADIHRLTAACKSRGVLPVLSLMIGNPYETQADVEATLRLLCEVDTHRLNLSVFTPFRGTPVYRHAHRYGVTLLTPNGSSGIINDDTGEVFHRTKHLSADQIREFWLDGVGIIMKRTWEARAFQPSAEAP